MRRTKYLSVHMQLLFFLSPRSSPALPSMAASKITLLSLILLFVLSLAVLTGADPVEGGAEAVAAGGSDSSALRAELDQLKSKFHILESLAEEKARELRSKDELISEKEKFLQDKLDKVASLQDEISTLQKKGKVDVAEQVGKARARAGELEKQIDKLKKDLDLQQKEKGSLASRVTETENKMLELNSKLERLQQINNEQRAKILRTERALKVAEEEMMKAKFEASSKIKELSEAHGAWLPPWLALHWMHLQSVAETHWDKHGKPAMNVMVQKAMEKKSQAGKWAEPHIETIKTKWVPVVKEKWVLLATSLEPHVKTLTAKSVEVYETSRTAIAPHVVKIQQVVNPFYQDAMKFSKPYIDQVAAAAKPHAEKIKVTLEPYTKEAVRAYGKFLVSASTYHKQMQGHVQETLKEHEITRALATKEFVWFAASALLALPVILLFRISSGLFCKKAKKPARHANSHHARRKTKRGHTDNK
ncbi:hypothetical protein SAY87_019222 [Trapa incisa]|uniref:Uncharacterized protein n=1 Tax=Trapa incisa TaxID=236973 RepID=A0AAN7Q1P3_9MYRT|nr:hypothetical protein SAY87_019222 [Trapa incisa]